PCTGNLHDANFPPPFRRAMPFRSATRHEPEEITERSKSLHIFRQMTGMTNFDAVEPQIHKSLDSVSSTVLSRMRPDRQRAGGMSELDCLPNLESRFGNES